MKLFARLAKLLAPRWPDGEPLIAGGVRWGTRLPSGEVIPAPNTSIMPAASCSCVGGGRAVSIRVAKQLEELNRSLRDLILRLEQDRNERRLGGLK